jgi:integrase
LARPLIKRIKTAFAECGYGWIISHVFRKAVASLLDDAGLPIGDIADQLGNTRTVAEQHYV